MDMNKSFFAKKEKQKPKWYVIDASDKVLGRLATKAATILKGKHKAEYTPHVDTGDYVVVKNCEKIVLTGNKWNDKTYISYSGWISGKKEINAKEVFRKDPTLLVKYAVKRMLPKNSLGRAMFKKLKVYAGGKHPHEAQVSGFSPEKTA